MVERLERPKRAASGEGGGARVTRRRAQTRARLLEAAFETFAAQGFGHVTIEQVCAAAGFTRGAFYSNFDSLDELFFALYDERAGQIVDRLAGAMGEREGLPLAAFVERATDALPLDRDWLLVKTDFLLHAARRPELARTLDEHRDRLRETLARRLATVTGHAGGPLADADAAARAVVTVHDGVAAQLLLDGDVATARAWLRRLLTALFAGDATDPGQSPG